MMSLFLNAYYKIIKFNQIKNTLVKNSHNLLCIFIIKGTGSYTNALMYISRNLINSIYAF